MRGWADLPQLGIVSDDLRLGLREGRSSTELRWPPAKACVGHPGAGAMNLRPYMANALRCECVGHPDAGAMNWRPYKADALQCGG
jgi:hypothetical protein